MVGYLSSCSLLHVSCIAGIGMFSSHKNRIRKDCNGDRRDHHINEANMMIGEKGEISRGMEAMI
jgi:hypothetical protein